MDARSLCRNSDSRRLHFRAFAMVSMGLFALSSSWALVSCGGGGSNASASSPTAAPTATPTPTPTPTPAPPLTLSYPSATPWFTVGSAIATQTPTLDAATGGTVFTLTDGTLPAGLTLNADGTLTGTPTQAGIYTFTLTATNQGSAGSFSLTATVEDNRPLSALYVIPTLVSGQTTPAILPTIGYGTPGLATTFSLATGSLPAGLSLAANGALSGTPTAAGSSTFQLNVTNGTHKATVTVQAVVNASGTFSITYPQSSYHIDTVKGLDRQDPTLHNATAGKSTIFALSGSGLPPDLTGMGTDASGVIWGIPSRPGTFRLVMNATNDGRTASASVELVVEDGNPLTCAYPLSTLVAGQNVGVVAPVIGHATPGYPTTFTLASGTLPAGLSLGSTGCISGTPTTAGAYNFTVKLSNGSRTGTQAFSGTVQSSNGLALSYPTNLWFKTGTAIPTVSPTLTHATGSTAYTLAKGALPNGITLKADGTLTGTPTDDPNLGIYTPGVYAFTIQAVNGGTTVQATSSCVVTPTEDLILAYPPRTLLQNQPALTVFPAVVNSVPGLPITYTFKSGSLPDGLVFNPDGTITGTPTKLGAFTATVEISSRNQKASATFTLTVVANTIHHPLESHWLGNTGGRPSMPNFYPQTMDDTLAWNGNAGNFLTDIAVVVDNNQGGIPTIWTLTQYDETGMGNTLDNPAQPGKQLGAVYYNGQRIGKAARSQFGTPTVNSSVSTDAKSGITATIKNYYGRFFNFSYAEFHLDPPPTDATGPYVSLSDGRSIHAVVDPTAVDFDLTGRLWIADNGPDQNIKIFDLSKSLTVPVATFGETGGVYAGATPGRTGDFRFWGPRGIAHDDQGHIYIGCAGMPCLQVGGTDLRMFSADGQTMLWQALGGFVQTADADPASLGTEMYMNGKHATMDYTKAPGKSWKWSGVTLDPFRYPQDPRVVMSHSGVWVRRIGGKLFQYMTSMSGDLVGIWRVLDNSEIAVPAGYLMLREQALGVDPLSPFKEHPLWDNTETNKRIRWFWRDGNGDAKIDKTEFGTWNNWTIYNQGIDIDENGGIWFGGQGPAFATLGGDGGVQYWPCQGLDAHGVPMYDFANPQHLDVPFTTLPTGQNAGVSRLKYIAKTDTMYFAATADGYYAWNIYRFDHFTDPKLRKQAYVMDTGFYAAGQGTNIHLDTTSWPMTLPWTFTADGDYIYVAYLDHGKDSLRRGEVTIYSAVDGHQVDFIVPGSEIGGSCGAVDLVNGIFVSTDALGWKIITLEDDGGAKVIAYRWKP